MRLLPRRHHVRGDRRPAGRQLGQGRHVQVAEHGHRHGARDRGGGHHQQVRRHLGLVAQGVALLDTEAVLLVDDDQAEVLEVDGVLDQRVGADHDAGVAADDVQQVGTPGGGRLRAGEQSYPGPDVGAAEQATLGQRAEHRRDGAVVLLREDLGGGEQRRLATAVDHGEHRAQGDHRLARAHLALEQPVHRVLARQVGGDGGGDLELPGGEGERQPVVERVEQPAGPRHPGGRRLGGRLGPPSGQHGLQHERLVVAQAVPGPAYVVAGVGLVHLAQRVAQPGQPATQPQLGRQRVIERFPLGQGHVQRDPDRLAQPPGRQLGGRRIDRHQAAGEVLRVVSQCHLGVRQGELVAVHLDLAGEERLLARHKEPFAVPLVEERDRHPGPAVGDDDIELVQLGPDLAAADGGDGRLHRGELPGHQPGEVGQLTPLVVATGVVPQQVLDRRDAQPVGHLLGRRATDHVADRVAECHHCYSTPMSSG